MRLVVFTVLRDPVAWVVSSYQYHCGKKRERACDCGSSKDRPCARGLSRARMIAHLRPNPQCAYLVHGWMGFSRRSPSRAAPPTRAECEAAAASLGAAADHVGRTESLGATLAWLGDALGAPAAPPVARNRNTKIHPISRVAGADLAAVAAATALDAALLGAAAPGSIR